MSAVELALVMPIFLTILFGFVEVGRVYYQSSLIERGLRAGAMFAARNPFPLTQSAKDTAENLIKRGTNNSEAPYLVEGWAKAGAEYALTTHTYDLGGQSVPIVRVTVAVPYDPILPGMAKLVGLGDDLKIGLSHEQSSIDD